MHGWSTRVSNRVDKSSVSTCQISINHNGLHTYPATKKCEILTRLVNRVDLGHSPEPTATTALTNMELLEEQSEKCPCKMQLMKYIWIINLHEITCPKGKAECQGGMVGPRDPMQQQTYSYTSHCLKNLSPHMAHRQPLRAGALPRILSPWPAEAAQAPQKSGSCQVVWQRSRWPHQGQKTS